MRKLIAPLLLFILVIVVFHSWFGRGLLSSYDFPYYSDLMIKNASLSSYAWDWHVGLDGFSRFIPPYSWIFPVLYIPQVFFEKLGLNWSAIERIAYLYPLLLLLIFSPIVLSKYFFPKNKFYLIAVLVFSFNSYSLLLASGQIFLALAYFLMPIVFVLFVHLVRAFKARDYKYPLITGFVFALQILVETRVAFITFFSIALYYLIYCLFNLKEYKKNSFRKYIHEFIFVFLIPVCIALLLHSFWIIPTIFYGQNPVEALGSSYSSFKAVEYLSFAKFENTIALLHPNWPENIFGKVYFMRPEFLLLPILAFLSLFFIAKEKDKKNKFNILFFSILGLVGAFLAKGTSEPFGNIYIWLFNNFPGFILFRDPAKWYPLVAISYAVLIPFSIWKIYDFLKLRNKIIVAKLLLFVIISCLMFLIKPAIFGQIEGTFKSTSVPVEYVKFEKFISNQPEYFRTVWLPQKQRFSSYSNTHPIISANVLFNIFDTQRIVNKLETKEGKDLLLNSSVKYIAIPYDSEKEIFLDDRKYSEKKYEQTVSSIRKIGFKEINGFGKIRVFETEGFRRHFSVNGQENIREKYISSVEYIVELKSVKKGDVLSFSESYDKNWKVFYGNSSIPSVKKGNFNSFILTKEGNYTLRVYYEFQKWVDLGLIISGSTLVLLVGYSFFIFGKSLYNKK